MSQSEYLNYPEPVTLYYGSFRSIAAFKAAIKASNSPVLVLADSQSVSTIIPMLRPIDDICLSSSPDALIRYRTQQLAQRQLESSI